MTPSDASLLTMLVETPSEYGSMREQLVEGLSEEVRELGEVLLAEPQQRDQFNAATQDRAAEFEDWVEKTGASSNDDEG